MRFKQGKPAGPLKKSAPARGTGTTVLFHPDPTIFPKIEFDAGHHPRASRGRQLPAQGRQGHLRQRGREGTRHVFSTTKASSTTCGRSSPTAAASQSTTQPFTLRDARTACGSTRAAVDRSHRRASAQLRQRHSDRVRRHARKRPARRHRQGVRNFIDTHNLSPKGVTLTADDIREGLIGVLSVFIAEPQFQGQTKDRLNNPELVVSGGSMRPAGARALAESQHQRRRVDRRAHHPRGARARGEPRRAGRKSRARAPRRRG